jgi:hypothetical protein
MRPVALGVLAGVLAGTALVAALGSSTSAQPAPDMKRVKELYNNAERAMTEGRHADAVRDYGEVYELTKDPVLFYKIGSANEKAGKCDVALIYYGRYLKEAKPAEQFIARTHERISACGGTIDPIGTPEPTGSATPTGSAAPEPAGSAAEPTPAAAGSAAPVVGKHRGPWLLVGGSLALVTVGAVLAYQADAAENDLRDLYVGIEGMPPAFNDRTRERYDAVVAEGKRYEKLSWASFGLAGALAIGAALWFKLGSSDDAPAKTSVMPTVNRDGAAVTTTIRF